MFKSARAYLRSTDEKPSVEASKRVEEIKHLHEQAKLKIKKSNASDQAQAKKHKRRLVLQLEIECGSTRERNSFRENLS